MYGEPDVSQGQAGPDHPGNWSVPECAALIEPMTYDLSCTKGDLRLPWLVGLGLC
jgi:hypothetical protein